MGRCRNDLDRSASPVPCAKSLQRPCPSAARATGAAPLGLWLETAPVPALPAARHLAASKRGLKRGLRNRRRTVVRRRDETIITETPPLYAGYGKVGQQTELPMTGNHAKRILHGVIHIKTGDLVFAITQAWEAETPQLFWPRVRHHWRGWHRGAVRGPRSAAHRWRQSPTSA